MKRFLIVVMLPIAFAGCADMQANYRPPRADELRPGDTAPPPGPFVDSMPRQRQYVQPMPAPYQLPTYQMPIQRSTTCTTQRFGNQLQTYCQ